MNKTDLGQVIDFAHVYYSINGAPFTPAQGSVRVELPAGDGVSLLQNVTSEGVITDVICGDDI